MMEVNSKKTEIREVGKEMFSSEDDYLNYHEIHKGVFAFRMQKGKKFIREESIEIVDNILTYFKYETERKEKVITYRRKAEGEYKRYKRKFR